jgi:hypothetical protein
VRTIRKIAGGCKIPRKKFAAGATRAQRLLALTTIG